MSSSWAPRPSIRSAGGCSWKSSPHRGPQERPAVRDPHHPACRRRAPDRPAATAVVVRNRSRRTRPQIRGHLRSAQRMWRPQLRIADLTVDKRATRAQASERAREQRRRPVCERDVGRKYPPTELDERPRPMETATQGRDVEPLGAFARCRGRGDDVVPSPKWVAEVACQHQRSAAVSVGDDAEDLHRFARFAARHQASRICCAIRSGSKRAANALAADW